MMSERQPDQRRHPRAAVSWPVTVETDQARFDVETVNLSPFGAKLKWQAARFEPGTSAQLRFHPPGGPPVEIQGIVWRVDPDGMAFFFVGGGAGSMLPTWPLESSER
jgi:PilZ domain